MATVTATVTAAAAPAPAPSPTALIAAGQRGVNLTAATSPYQLLQDAIDTVLPALVNTFGAKPTITLQSLLSQIPPDLLTDVLNANGGAINVSSLLGTLGTSGTSLNSAVTDAITSALGSYLSAATTGAGATALTSELSSAIASAVAGQLNGLKISVNVPVLGTQTISLASIVGSSGITSIANSVANSVAGNIVANLSSILPTPEQLAGDITPVLPNLLNTVLNSADLTDANGNFQLGNLLNLLGVNLGSIEGANALTVTTAGPLFTLARLFGGVDLGWVPGTETAIAKSVNSTGYLDVGTSTLKANLAAALSGALSDGSLASSLTGDLTPVLNTIVSQIVDNATNSVQTDLTNSINGALAGLNYSVSIPFVGKVTIPVGSALQSAVDPLVSGLASSLNGSLQGSVSGAVSGAIGSATGSISDALNTAVNDAIDAIPTEDLADVRIPIVIGTGLGAFSAGAAYKDVLAQLSSQPGGANYTGTNPLLGSLTILPEILLNNAGRANGGLLARFSSILKLFGIDAVTPDVAISSSGGTAVGNTGLALGGANLVPIKIDATAEYQLMSDFAAWPNPFTLVNNVAAGLLPTYMLRGLDASGVVSQLTTQLESVVSGLAGQNSVDPNIYLTIAAHTLPMLEPLYLVGDAMNLLGLKPIGGLADGLANALSPALTSLVNLGYSDAYWNPATGQYERTLDSAAQQVQFGTLPNVNWSQVVPNILTSLVTGFQKAFTADNSQPNALQTVISALNGGLNINTLLSGLTGAASSAAAAKIPAPTAAVVVPAQSGITANDLVSKAPVTPVTPASSDKSDTAGAKSGTTVTDTSTTTLTKAQRKAEWQAKRAAAKAAQTAGTATISDPGTPSTAGTTDTGTPDSSNTTGAKHAHKDAHKGGHRANVSAGAGDSTNSNSAGTKGNSTKHHTKSGSNKHAA